MPKQREIRATGPVLKALALFLEYHPQPLSGADIIAKRRILSGTMYPALERLEQAGWIKSEWENVDPSTVGRPRKRFYNLTPRGLLNAGDLLLEFGIQVSTGKAKRPSMVEARKK